MNNIIYALFLTAILTSCTMKEIILDEKQKQAEVTFVFMEPADADSRISEENQSSYDYLWKDYIQCLTGFDEQTGQPLPFEIDVTDLLTHIIVKTQVPNAVTKMKEEWLTISKQKNGTWITSPLQIDANKEYTIETIEITGLDKTTIYYSGVKENTAFAPYVGQTLPQRLIVGPYEKPEIDVWVLCARKRTAYSSL